MLERLEETADPFTRVLTRYKAWEKDMVTVLLALLEAKKEQVEEATKTRDVHAIEDAWSSFVSLMKAYTTSGRQALNKTRTDYSLKKRPVGRPPKEVQQKQDSEIDKLVLKARELNQNK